MIGALARKLFGSSNERRIKAFQPRVDAINALEKELEKLSDEELRARTEDFKKQVADGKSLDDILVPAFATVPVRFAAPMPGIEKLTIKGRPLVHR